MSTTYQGKELTIRELREDDFSAVLEIDQLVSGFERPDYLRRKLRAQEEKIVASFVAELGHKIIGFLMASVVSGEYGQPDSTATLDTLGVHPEFQRTGVARHLLETFVDHCRVLGAEKIFTLVNWSEWDLLQFFDAAGFTPARQIPLEMEVWSKGSARKVFSDGDDDHLGPLINL